MQDFYCDRERCIRCGLCVQACARQALEADEEGAPFQSAANVTQCNACGHCAAICPVEAVIAPKNNGEGVMAFPASPVIGAAQGDAFLLSCRSMRRYKQDIVKEEEILSILDVARKAPSASNMQPVRWLVLRGKDNAARFSELTLEWFDKILRHDPVFGQRYNVDRLLESYRNGYDVILRGAVNAVVAITDKGSAWGPVDASIAITYFCLAAHARGIGSCWSGFGMRAMEAYQPLRDFMGLDDSVTAQGMAFFGYPEISYQAIPPRKPLQVSWL